MRYREVLRSSGIVLGEPTKTAGSSASLHSDN